MNDQPWRTDADENEPILSVGEDRVVEGVVGILDAVIALADAATGTLDQHDRARELEQSAARLAEAMEIGGAYEVTRNFNANYVEAAIAKRIRDLPIRQVLYPKLTGGAE